MTLARTAAILAALALPLALTACGGEDYSEFDEMLRKGLPQSRAVAVGYMFYDCDIDGGRGACENCDITIHPDDNGGYRGTVTHWYHDMRFEDGQWVQAVTGERGRQKLESNETGTAASSAMLEEAGKWCAARRDGKGEFVVLKQEG
ncbi:MAG: hypothetical protein KDJ62_05750 [Rhodobiaceae bacterium]|nr:hypothetical protein [Rhodobiaceae bacterium]MCC0049648.1 hypothetical protein [Rhodobiaceae bacterium]